MHFSYHLKFELDQIKIYQSVDLQISQLFDAVVTLKYRQEHWKSLNLHINSVPWKKNAALRFSKHFNSKSLLENALLNLHQL